MEIPGVNSTRISDEPDGRLTELAHEMGEVLDRPENGDVRAVIFLSTDAEGGGLLHNYDDYEQALGEGLAHLKGLAEAYGVTLLMVPMNALARPN